MHRDHEHGHQRHRHGHGPERGERFARGDGRHGFGRHGDHAGGRRGGRMFDHGELRLVVLALIAERPRYGYEIIKEIEERLGGGYSPSPGVIYPTLTLLEELGHATVAEAGGKKHYTITPEGQAALATSQAAVDAALGRMRDVGATRTSAGQPQIVRAMENLKLALRLAPGARPADRGATARRGRSAGRRRARGGAELMATLRAEAPPQNGGRPLQPLCKHWPGEDAVSTRAATRASLCEPALVDGRIKSGRDEAERSVRCDRPRANRLPH